MRDIFHTTAASNLGNRDPVYLRIRQKIGQSIVSPAWQLGT